MAPHSKPAAACRSLRIVADDPGRAQESVARTFGSHSRQALGREPYQYELTAACAGGVIAAWQSTTAPAVIKAAVQGPTLHLPARLGSEYRVGRRTLRSACDRAVLLAPGHDYTVRSSPGMVFGFRVDSELLREALDLRRASVGRSCALRSMELPLNETAVASIQERVRQFVHAVDGTRSSTIAVDVAAWENSIATLLAELILEHEGVHRTPPSGLQLAADLDRWIRAHASEPITLERMASALRVGSRWLQKTCMLHFGRSPLDLVLTRRLDLVRDRLLAASTADSVTHAAVECGFTHLGRFSVQYRGTFGESPRDTLARARQRMADALISDRPRETYSSGPGPGRGLKQAGHIGLRSPAVVARASGSRAG